ncbi:helix-turn-helix domain-containing protein [Paenibacillus cymbidii]|uniref:helix-turn-helix domain-containing protein n=1 Tax=Paenibacillus cymbidii TaxID=1639034 RepID=UPI001436CB5D|nr:AraC family transcriptional regulator [Paenibacillus cymbidii]
MAGRFKPQTLRSALFWQFFAKYFVLILVPVIAASTFTNVFVVRLIERGAEQSSARIMRDYAQQTDKQLQALQAGMIQLLGAANLQSLLTGGGNEPYDMERLEKIYALMAQMNAIRTEPIVSGAFLYFASADLVIDNNIYTNKSYYFKQTFALEPADRDMLQRAFAGKQMMRFTQPYHVRNPDYQEGAYLSVITGYPFNESDPDVFLSVQIRREQLQRLIRTQEDWIARTAIVDGAAAIVTQSDEAAFDRKALRGAMEGGTENTLNGFGAGQAVSYVRSAFNPDWYYVTWVDLGTLLQPARTLKLLSVGFFGFFILVGACVSYYLSRRLHNPIAEIRNRLQSHRSLLAAGSVDIAPQDNDFDVIRRFSQLLLAEHKELSQLVKGILPMVQEDFVTRILSGEYRDELAIAFYAKEIAFAYEPEAARAVFVIEYRYYEQTLAQLSETSKSFLLAELKEKLAKRLEGAIWLCQTGAGELACVVRLPKGEPDGRPEAASRIKEVLGTYASFFKAAVGVGKTAHAMGELHLSYRYGAALLKQKSLRADVEVFADEEAAVEREAIDGYLSAEDVNRIANQYRSGQYELLLQTALELLEAGIRKGATAFQTKSLGADVLNAWIREVEAERNDFSFAYYAELFEALNRCQSWEELKLGLTKIHGTLFRPPTPAGRREQFAEVVDYIRGHYREELSIEQLAGRLSMSVSHFSRTFKEAVGEKYVEYVTKLRLAEAKRLLGETDMKIEEIAEAVGYLGSNAFIRIFRKYEGITPGKYRGIR